MLMHTEKITKTASSGSFSSTTQTIDGLCLQVIVKPTTSNTIYDITITNSASLVMYKRVSETGELSEFVEMPFNGVYTIAIDNATVDEEFTIHLMVRER